MDRPPATDWPGFARAVIAARLAGADPDDVPPPPNAQATHSGAFVTLRRFNRLRGCVGTLDANQSIAEAIRHAALSAAFNDTRFQPLTAAELPDVRLEVSVLSAPAPMRTLDDLILGTHGVIIQQGAQRGLFLPKVATDHGLSKEDLLARCCSEKAGLPTDAWRDPNTEVSIFTCESYAESG